MASWGKAGLPWAALALFLVLAQMHDLMPGEFDDFAALRAKAWLSASPDPNYATRMLRALGPEPEAWPGQEKNVARIREVFASPGTHPIPSFLTRGLERLPLQVADQGVLLATLALRLLALALLWVAVRSAFGGLSEAIGWGLLAGAGPWVLSWPMASGCDLFPFFEPGRLWFASSPRGVSQLFLLGAAVLLGAGGSKKRMAGCALAWMAMATDIPGGLFFGTAVVVSLVAMRLLGADRSFERLRALALPTFLGLFALLIALFAGFKWALLEALGSRSGFTHLNFDSQHNSALFLKLPAWFLASTILLRIALARTDRPEAADAQRWLRRLVVLFLPLSAVGIGWNLVSLAPYSESSGFVFAINEACKSMVAIPHVLFFLLAAVLLATGRPRPASAAAVPVLAALFLGCMVWKATRTVRWTRPMILAKEKQTVRAENLLQERGHRAFQNETLFLHGVANDLRSAALASERGKGP